VFIISVPTTRYFVLVIFYWYW